MAKKEKETNTKKETKEVVFITKELKQKRTSNEEYEKVKAFAILLVIILIFIGALAVLNGNFVTKDYKDSTTTTTTEKVEFDSQLLTVDRVFKVEDKEYMVLFYNSASNMENDFAKEFVGKYKDENVKLYTVDMASAMNKSYYDEKGKENTKPTSSEEIVITRTTLMTIKKGKVTSYVTDRAEIANKLNTKKDE